MRRVTSKVVTATAVTLLTTTLLIMGLSYGNKDRQDLAEQAKSVNNYVPKQTMESVVTQIENANQLDPDANQSTFNPVVGGHNHVHWRQKNYSNKIYISTISGGGCGWCSLVGAMAYLNPDKCANLSPVDWLSIQSSSVKHNWAGSGMGWGAPKQWIDHVNSLGTYGKYKLLAESTGSSNNTSNILKVIEKYAKDPDKAVILSCSSGLFTSAGHIICCTDLSDDGKSFHISDSSGRASGYLGITWDDSAKYDFPLNKTSLCGRSYYFKCYWVIQRLS